MVGTLPLLLALDTLRVPADYPTIQKAVEAAKDGDTVVVAAGTYRENIVLRGKTIALSSRDAETTIIDGGGRTCIVVDASVGAGTRIEGFTLRNGQDGITVNGARLHILNNRILGNPKEGISFESGGGVVRGNLIEGSGDDGIDCDDAVSVTIEDNIIRENKDDGIEIRLQPYDGPPLVYEIRGNRISGNREDGLQLIDYPGRSPRSFRVERNVFHASAMAGLGCMSDGNTVENYAGSSMEEPAVVVNNTFVENGHGMTGANQLVVANNVFLRNRKTGLKRVKGDSVATFNLFWGNGTDSEECKQDHTLSKDPMLGDDYRPRDGSPCIDAGTASIERRLKLPRESYAGAAPDLGAFERK